MKTTYEAYLNLLNTHIFSTILTPHIVSYEPRTILIILYRSLRYRFPYLTTKLVEMYLYKSHQSPILQTVQLIKVGIS